MVEREVFLLKPEHQYHLYQRRECLIGPNDEKKGDYYLNPCLTQFKDELEF